MEIGFQNFGVLSLSAPMSCRRLEGILGLEVLGGVERLFEAQRAFEERTRKERLKAVRLGHPAHLQNIYQTYISVSVAQERSNAGSKWEKLTLIQSSRHSR
jgi:hypothetical protein